MGGARQGAYHASVRIFRLSIFALLFNQACTRSDELSSVGAASAAVNGPNSPAARPPSAAPSAAAPAPGPVAVEPPGAPIAAPARLVAVGDLHGDLAATLAVLKLAGATDDAGHWVGGALTLVQTGDQIDRGDDDRAVLELFARLADEAPKVGGRVIALSGNHELMNVVHDFRYVTPGSNPAFGGEEGRRRAFRPGGEFARLLADRPVVAQVGDSVFVHGGVLESHLRYGLARLNREAAAFVRGEGPAPDLLMAPDSPVWTRAYSAEPGPEACAEAQRVLRALGATRMVVGHTVQPDGIRAACDDAVWRIDVGLARAYGGAPQALEVRGAEVRVLR